jgi:hypothetical protein
VFRYRRVIAPSIRAIAGKREILVSLRTADVKIAELRFMSVHLAAEAWLRDLIQNAYSASPVPSHFAWTSNPPLCSAPDRPQVHPPVMPLPERNGPTLDDALRLYLNEKRFELDAYKGRDRQVRINEKVRVVRYLKECVGEEKRIGEFVRADVRAFRDRLAARGLAARSIRKNIEVAAAIVQTSISEYGIATPNPFHRFPVTTDAPASEARLPLTSGELGHGPCRPDP